MNNVIIKLLIVLVTLSTISFVDSELINKRSPSTEGVIIGPETPVYYLTYPHDDYLKVIRDVNKFKASPSYNYYRNPENKFNDTFFPKILVVSDWYNRSTTREQDILNKVITDWNKVDKYFEKLENPKIKLAIAGVVIPTKSNTWGPVNVVPSYYNPHGYDHRRSLCSRFPCYEIPFFTYRMMLWFRNHADQFENLNYDFFIFKSYYPLAMLGDNLEHDYLCNKVSNFACDTKIGSGHYSLGGIVRGSDYNFPICAATVIASMLGVNSDREYSWENYFEEHCRNYCADLTWNNDSLRAVRSMVNNSKYTCLQQIPYKQDKFSPLTEGVIIGPDTPVYYLTYPRDDYLRVIREVNKFEASASYNYYRLPENKSNGTFFPKVLLVLDWHDVVGYRTEQQIIDEVLTKWNKVDKYFEQLDNPKIKLAIAGVVIPTKLNIWKSELVTAHSYYEIRTDELISRRESWSSCYLIPSLTNNLTKWFNDNADQFESLKYDLFMFMSCFELTSSRNIEKCEYPYHKTNKFACDTKHDSDHRSPGGIVMYKSRFTELDEMNDNVFIKSAAYIIASILGVKTDQEYGCGSGYIMDSREFRVSPIWSGCSKRAFNSMANNTKYTCLHQIPHYQDEDDYS